MSDINSEKKLLRRRYRSVRDSLSPELQARCKELHLSRLLELEQYRNADTVLCYYSVGSEADTAGIIRRALQDGKTVACPVCGSSRREMTFRCIASPDDLVPGSYGIPEPQTDAPPVGDDRMHSSICIVPALSFDASGGRLGYGGGYYDRFLSGYSGFSVGLCSPCCKSDEPLPRDSFDVRVDLVLFFDEDSAL